MKYYTDIILIENINNSPMENEFYARNILNIEQSGIWISANELLQNIENSFLIIINNIYFDSFP